LHGTDSHIVHIVSLLEIFARNGAQSAADVGGNIRLLKLFRLPKTSASRSDSGQDADQGECELCAQNNTGRTPPLYDIQPEIMSLENRTRSRRNCTPLF
jgi:hypothetical protein